MGWIARCITWCAACGGYLLFAGEVRSRDELITAAVLASAASLWAWTLRRSGRQRFAMSFAHVCEWAKAVAALGPALAKTFPVFIAIAVRGRSPGHLLGMLFQRGAEDDPADAARRASALRIASLGPDNIVVRMPPGEDRVVLHGILPADAPRDPRWLNP